MKALLFLCGPNGIGKTTICRRIVKQLPNSAYVDSDPCRFMNPFVLNDETMPTIRKNISGMLINYLKCPVVQTVIFSYGFHGRRKEIFDSVMNDLSKYEFRFIPFLLTCSEEENIRRMKSDNRDVQRIQYALEASRKAFDNISYPKIDITRLSAGEAVDLIIEKAGVWA